VSLISTIAQCWEIALGSLATVGAVTLGPIGWKIYKTGLRATSVYLTRLPSRIFGYALFAFRQKVTLALAFLTAFRGTIQEFGNILSAGAGVSELGLTFLSELWNQILLAPVQISAGLQHFLDFAQRPGVCGKLLNTGLLWQGAIDVWTGLSAVIIIVYLYKESRFRVRGRKPNNMDIGIFLVAVFGAATAFQAGLEGTSLLKAVESGQTLAEMLSGVLDQGVNETFVNQSVNSSSG
jgi:hypothetical protein